MLAVPTSSRRKRKPPRAHRRARASSCTGAPKTCRKRSISSCAPQRSTNRRVILLVILEVHYGPHKYTYVHGDPIQLVDPTGLVGSLFGTSYYGLAVERVIRDIYIADHRGQDTLRSGRATRIGPRPPRGTLGSLYYAKPDLINHTTFRYGEIKPLSLSGITSGAAQMALRAAQFAGTGYAPDATWVPSRNNGIALGQPFTFVNVNGLVFYTDILDNVEDVVALSSLALARRFVAQHGGRLALRGALAAGRGLAVTGARVIGTQVIARVSLAIAIKV